MPLPFTTETGNLWVANQFATGPNKLPMPTAATRLAGGQGIRVVLERGNQASKEQAYALGLDVQLAGILYADMTYRSLFEVARIFEDQFGAVWSIETLVEVRPEISVLSHIKMVITLLIERPTGLPVVTTESVLSGRAGRSSQADIKLP